MYILKTKGVDKVADYIQFRDDKMHIIKYSKLSRLNKDLKELGFSNEEIKVLEEKILKTEYGILNYIDK